MIQTKKKIMERKKEIIRIIIADDNVSWCEAMKIYLEKFKEFEIVGMTSDAEEEIEMLKNLKADILLTDLKRNNEFIGMEIIKKCYEENLLKNTKVLVETAGYYLQEINLLRNMGIHHILFKPFKLEKLKEELLAIQREDKNLLIVNNDICKKKKTVLDVIRSNIKKLKMN